jgi:transcriptional regulator with XRE-family HTH domain
MSVGLNFNELGERLKAHRIGNKLGPDELAERLGISRAALYRAEKGQIRKIEMLEDIARELGVSLASLLGVGVEYISTATTFFQRMCQLEDESQQIIGMFSPISYLLTSDEFDTILHRVIVEGAQKENRSEAEAAEHADHLLGILRARKLQFQRRRPLIASLIQTRDLERFLLRGMTGHNDLPEPVATERRRAARREVEHIRSLLEDQPIGIQIGLVTVPGPGTSFQIFRRASQSVLAVSPYSLGEQPNTRLGVAFITAAPDAVGLHEDLAARSWEETLKGSDAIDHLNRLIDTYGI